MPIFTFRGLKPSEADNLTTVSAPDEAAARDLAMFARWGDPDGRVLLKRPYLGRGLALIEEDTNV